MIFSESGRKAEEFPTLSVVGMDGIFGNNDGLDQIRDALYFGKSRIASAQNELVENHAPEAHAMSFSEYGFGFIDNIQTTSEQRAGLRVGLRALKNAGIDLLNLSKFRIAILFASSSAEQCGTDVFGSGQAQDDQKASLNGMEKILKMGGMNCDIFDLSNFDSPLTAGILFAEKRIIGHKADLVVLVASGVGSSAASGTDTTPLPSTFSEESPQHQAGEEAGAIVFQASDQAIRSKRFVYCQIQAGSVSNSSWVGRNPLNIEQSTARNLQDVLDMAAITAHEIGVVEICQTNSGFSTEEVLQNLQRVFQNHLSSSPGCAVTSAGRLLGTLTHTTEMASFIACALQISERMICRNEKWPMERKSAALGDHDFYFPENSRTWFEKTNQPKRLALLAMVQRGDNCTHLLLSESSQQMENNPFPEVRINSFLIPICGDDQEELMGQLHFLQASIVKSMDLADLQKFWVRKWERRQAPVYTAVLLGGSRDALLHEIQFATNGIPKSIAHGSEWQTPGGSYFSPNPLGPHGKIAFVYPGAFNSQIDSGKDLFYCFPALHQFCRRLSQRIGDVLYEERLYPRLQTPLSDSLRAAMNQQMVEDPMVMLSSGTALAVLYTQMLREIFQLQPSMSFGYSLGENSMMFAAGVWNQGEAALQRLQQSALFNERISGKQSAIHEFWQENQPGSVKGPAWANYILMGDAHNLQTEIDQTPKVYLTHINTPRQVVIGGAPQACEDFIALRKINFIKAPFNHALHCEPVQSEWQEFHYLHDWPINETPDYDIYTAATYEKSELTSGAIARNIAQTLTTPLDFPRLVGKVYEDGARIFIETGAGSNCSKWIDHILKNKEHLSVSINQHGVGDGLSVLRCLAKCISHRIPVDLEALVNKKHQPSRLVVKG